VLTTAIRGSHEARVTVHAPWRDVQAFLSQPESLPTVLGRLQHVYPISTTDAIWTLAEPRAPFVRRRMRQSSSPERITYIAAEGTFLLVAFGITPASASTCSVRIRREAAVGAAFTERLDAQLFARWLPLADAVRLRALFE
jgi:hypothetical protein